MDTSVLINFLKGRDTDGSLRLNRLEAEQTPFYLPAICFQEVLQGAKDQREFRVLEKYLGTQEILLPMDPLKCHREAAHIFFLCRRAGITVRSTVDCFIAAMVTEKNGTLLADGTDFRQISRVVDLRLA